MVSTFEDLGGEIKYLRRLVDRNVKTWSAFNPSIGIDDKGNCAVAFRSSNYVILEHGELSVTTGGPIRNQVWFAELNSEWGLENLRKIDFSGAGIDVPRGVEDPKLLWRDGKWVFTAVFLERNTPTARNCVCYLDSAATKVTHIEIIQGFDTKRPEKNWMTASKKPKKFDYVYDSNGIVIGDRIIHRMRDAKELAKLRGNAHLIEMPDGTYLGMMHSLRIRKTQKFSGSTFGIVEYVEKYYEHYVMRFSNEGWATEISEPFVFVSPGIEFANGVIIKDNRLVISFGKDDVSSHLAIIDFEKILKIMKSIDD